jgi:hypothetical protein
MNDAVKRDEEENDRERQIDERMKWPRRNDRQEMFFERRTMEDERVVLGTFLNENCSFLVRYRSGVIDPSRKTRDRDGFRSLFFEQEIESRLRVFGLAQQERPGMVWGREAIAGTPGVLVGWLKDPSG